MFVLMPEEPQGISMTSTRLFQNYFAASGFKVTTTLKKKKVGNSAITSTTPLIPKCPIPPTSSVVNGVRKESEAKLVVEEASSFYTMPYLPSFWVRFYFPLLKSLDQISRERSEKQIA